MGTEKSQLKTKTDLKLGETKIPKLIIQMSLPAMVAMLVQATYNIVDSIFIAQINEEALAAVSLVFPIQMIVVAIFVGLGIGINSVISRKLGAQDRDEASNAAEHGFFIGAVLALFILVLGLIMPKPFLQWFTEDELILDYATTYATIVMVFAFASILTQVCISILQATGDMVTSMKIQLTGAITNLILDPILIFGVGFVPALGIKGAAIATVTGQIASMIFGFVMVLTRSNAISLDLKKFHFKAKMVGQIIIVGVPAMLMQGLASVMITGLNLILAGFGTAAVAVMGAYYKLQSFIFMPVFGLAQGIMPIAGYNYGAKNKERLIETLKYAIGIACSIMLIGTFVFLVFPKQLIGAFNPTKEMQIMAVEAFRIISIGYVLAAISIVISTVFQATGDAYISLINSFARQIVVLIPCAYGLSKVWGITGVWVAFPISEVVTVIMSVAFLLYIYNKRIKNLAE